MNIIVDLDGTVLDSRQRLHRLFRDLVSESDIGEDEYWRLKREPRSHRWLLEHRLGWSPDRIGAFEDTWLDRIETEDYLALDRVMGDVDGALASLASRATLHLVTARRFPEAAIGQLKALALDHHFASILPTGPARNKAETIRDAGLRLSAGDIVVGDTGEDVATARAFGAVAVGVTSGFRSAEYLRARGADYLYADLSDFAARHFG